MNGIKSRMVVTLLAGQLGEPLSWSIFLGGSPDNRTLPGLQSNSLVDGLTKSISVPLSGGS